MLVFEILNKILLTFMFENFPALFRYNYQIKIISISGVQCDSFIYIYKRLIYNGRKLAFVSHQMFKKRPVKPSSLRH